MKEVYSSISNSIHTRVKSPIIGSFLISWLVLNWEIVLILLFGEQSINDKIHEINDYLSNYKTVMIYPIIISLFYTILLPWLNFLVERIHKSLRNNEQELKSLVEINKIKQERKSIIEKKKNEVLISSSMTFNELFKNSVSSSANEKIHETLKDFDIILKETKDIEFVDHALETGIIQLSKHYTSSIIPFISFHDERMRDYNSPIYYEERLKKEPDIYFIEEFESDVDQQVIYKQMAIKFYDQMDRLNDFISNFHQGNIEKCSFKLEKGSIIYHRVFRHSYIIGVCLDNRKVIQAEWEMKKLSENIQKYFSFRYG